MYESDIGNKKPKSSASAAEKSSKSVDNIFEKYLMPIVNQEKGKKLKRSDEILGEKTNKKYR